MSDWVTSIEAQAMLGNMNHSSFYSAAEAQGWPSEKGFTGVHPCKMWRTKDIQAYATERQRRSGNRYRHDAPATLASGVREIVKWADGLKRWPADEEIEARVCVGYGVKVIELILETRVDRGLKALKRRGE